MSKNKKTCAFFKFAFLDSGGSRNDKCLFSVNLNLLNVFHNNCNQINSNLKFEFDLLPLLHDLVPRRRCTFNRGTCVNYVAAEISPVLRLSSSVSVAFSQIIRNIPKISVY